MTMLTPRTPTKLAPPGRSRRERKAAELESRTRLVGERLAEISARPGVQVLQEVDASPAGLTHAEAALRLERHGPNVVAHERAPRWYVQLAKAYWNPFIAVLVFLAAVMYWQDPADPGVVILSVMVGISGLLRFWQEFRSGRAADALKQLVTTTCAVQRRAGSGSAPDHLRGAHGPGGPGRRGQAGGRRPDPGRPAARHRQGPVRQPGGPDRRVHAGGEGRHPRTETSAGRDTTDPVEADNLA